MNKQKAVLVGLIVILIAVVAVGASTVGFNHTGHGTTATQAPTKTEATPSTDQAEPTQPSPKTDGEAKEDSSAQDQKFKQQQAATEQALAQLKNGMTMIKEGTGLMANDAYVGQQQGQVSMDKVHQGIYKMAQGTLLVDQAMGAVDQNLLTAQLQQQLQQQLALQQQMAQQMQQMQQQPQGQTVDPNSAHSAATHNTSTSSGQIVTYAIYAFMVISFVGVFAGIAGLIRNLFKPAVPAPGGEQNG